MLKNLPKKFEENQKLWIVKWQQTHNYQQLNLNKQTKKDKLGKKLEKVQNHRNGDHMQGYQQAEGDGRRGEKVQGIRHINGR